MTFWGKLVTISWVLVLSACGGSSSNSTDATPSSGPPVVTTPPTTTPPVTSSSMSQVLSKFTLPPQDAQGWSILTPSADSRLIYVSSSDGNDSTARSYSPGDPEVGTDPFKPTGAVRAYATIEAAYKVARSKFPDYVLLKRGDAWTQTQSINVLAGRSKTERSVLGYYGSRVERPLVRVKSPAPNALQLYVASNAVVQGIRFYAPERDPKNTAEFVGFSAVPSIGGFVAVAGFRDGITGGLLIEDCWFDGFAGNSLQSFKGPDLTDLVVRRNIITNNYATNAHSQGLFTDRVSLLLEENIFDHNGWVQQGFNNDSSQGGATIFNHNTYFGDARDTIFRNNLFLRSSSIGTKFTSNAKTDVNTIESWNLLIDNNLYVEGEVIASLGGNDSRRNGPRWKNVQFTNNVAMHIGRTRPTLRTLGWGVDAFDWDGGLIEGNVFKNWGSASSNPKVLNTYAISLYGYSNDVSIAKNIIWNVVSDNALVSVTSNLSASYPSVNQRTTFKDNVVATNHTGVLVDYSAPSNTFFGGNRFQSNHLTSRWFKINGTLSPLATYLGATTDTTSMAQTPSFVDPERTIETYLISLGHPSDMDSFAAELVKQSKFNWKPQWQAATINDYIRAGFRENP